MENEKYEIDFRIATEKRDDGYEQIENSDSEVVKAVADEKFTIVYNGETVKVDRFGNQYLLRAEGFFLTVFPEDGRWKAHDPFGSFGRLVDKSEQVIESIGHLIESHCA